MGAFCAPWVYTVENSDSKRSKTGGAARVILKEVSEETSLQCRAIGSVGFRNRTDPDLNTLCGFSPGGDRRKLSNFQIIYSDSFSSFSALIALARSPTVLASVNRPMDDNNPA